MTGRQTPDTRERAQAAYLRAGACLHSLHEAEKILSLVPLPYRPDLGAVVASLHDRIDATKRAAESEERVPTVQGARRAATMAESAADEAEACAADLLEMVRAAQLRACLGDRHDAHLYERLLGDGKYGSETDYLKALLASSLRLEALLERIVEAEPTPRCKTPASCIHIHDNVNLRDLVKEMNAILGPKGAGTPLTGV